MLGCTEYYVLYSTGAPVLFEQLRQHAAAQGLDLTIPDTHIKSQRLLSHAIDKIELVRISGGPFTSRSWLHHASACKIQGAGAWLNAIPDRPSLQMELDLFRTAVSRRFRVRSHPRGEAK